MDNPITLGMLTVDQIEAMVRSARANIEYHMKELAKYQAVLDSCTIKLPAPVDVGNDSFNEVI